MERHAEAVSCPDCYALTDDLAAHGRWHARLVHDLALAVNKESERREAARPR